MSRASSALDTFPKTVFPPFRTNTQAYTFPCSSSLSVSLQSSKLKLTDKQVLLLKCYLVPKALAHMLLHPTPAQVTISPQFELSIFLHSAFTSICCTGSGDLRHMQCENKLTQSSSK